MKRSSVRLMLLLMFLVFCFPSTLAETISENHNLTYTRLYTDADGVSHYGEATIEFAFENYAPPAHPLAVHHLENAKGATRIHIPTGTFEDWHPVPRRQFMFILKGAVEVGVSDGEVRQFGPGTVVILEDLTGKGHTTKVIGDEDNLSLAVPVPIQE